MLVTTLIFDGPVAGVSLLSLLSWPPASFDELVIIFNILPIDWFFHPPWIPRLRLIIKRRHFTSEFIRDTMAHLRTAYIGAYFGSPRKFGLSNIAYPCELPMMFLIFRWDNEFLRQLSLMQAHTMIKRWLLWTMIRYMTGTTLNSIYILSLLLNL